MKAIRALLFLLLPVAVAAHPGGGLIALDVNTVIFGDSTYNTVWRLEKGKKPQALVKKFHAHWTTRGLDGHIYSESFQEMGGALFRIPLDGGKHVKVAEESDLQTLVFAVGKRGELIFQKAAQIMERSADGTVRRFRGSGEVAKGEPPLQQVIAYHWAADETLYLSDGNNLRRAGSDGVVRLVARVDGKLIEPKIWNSTGAPRIWSIATDGRKRIYSALPDTGEVVRIDPDGSQHVIDRSAGGWRVTAVATFGDSVFLLESSDSSNAGQRVRVIRGDGKAEMLGQVPSDNL
jgi:sugar lactone lactonase YvrE